MRILILLGLLTFRPLHALSSATHEEFIASFDTGYVAGKCAVNVQNLIARLRLRGVDLSEARVAVFSNGGYLFSVTHRRNVRVEAGISNFYHHVVLVKDGLVYDYDFGNRPRVLPMKQYVKAMFWDEPAKTEYTGLEPLRLREDYRVSLVPALDYERTLSTEGADARDLSDFYDALPNL